MAGLFLVGQIVAKQLANVLERLAFE